MGKKVPYPPPQNLYPGPCPPKKGGKKGTREKIGGTTKRGRQPNYPLTNPMEISDGPNYWNKIGLR